VQSIIDDLRAELITGQPAAAPLAQPVAVGA
jgi:hypothetical protein